MRILLLEDDEPTRAVYRECIASAGHEVIECGTIERAITVLRTKRIDLFVIDLLIGKSNSLGFAQFAGYAAPDAEIILITGTGSFTKGEVLAEYPGISWILRKPLPVGDLKAFVDYAGRRRSQRCQIGVT
ncbi:response regulator [Roseovarius aestuarii]|uniref:DNA-binding transcriptional activator KdpE n=1 Tax=Roseovarius aestuarii TaxID=475083 RepID=A0A1X7BRL6_9RHOB|nr:response regulator [Roseovarius aestuarii]SMC12261.1 DNA-binding transcriptional activator KdpE [Roseovarius aestuarii]